MCFHREDDSDSYCFCLQGLGNLPWTLRGCGCKLHLACAERLDSLGFGDLCPLCSNPLEKVPPGPKRMHVSAAQRWLAANGRYGAGAWDVSGQPRLDDLPWKETIVNPGDVRDLAKLTQLLRAAAERGHMDAQYLLAKMYRSAQGLEQDFAKAFHWGMKAAKQGQPWAQYLVAKMYRDGQHEDGVDYKKMVEWCRKASEQKHAEATYYLAGMYRLGKGVDQDDDRALQLIEKAAEQGSVSAYSQLGGMYGCAELVERDEKASLKWSLKAAHHGDVEAQYNVALELSDLLPEMNGMYGSMPPRRNNPVAAYWAMEAAHRGSNQAKCLLAIMFEKGSCVPQSDELAVEWYRKAARAGQKRADMGLGNMYYEGRGGLKKDDEQAYAWYERASEKGFYCATNLLANGYINGHGGLPKDVGLAVALLEEIVECKHPLAMTTLAMIYLHGAKGVPQDLRRASDLFRQGQDRNRALSPWQNSYLTKKIDQRAWTGIKDTEREIARCYDRARKVGATVESMLYLQSIYGFRGKVKIVDKGGLEPHGSAELAGREALAVGWDDAAGQVRVRLTDKEDLKRTEDLWLEPENLVSAVPLAPSPFEGPGPAYEYVDPNIYYDIHYNMASDPRTILDGCLEENLEDEQEEEAYWKAHYPDSDQ